MDRLVASYLESIEPELSASDAVAYVTGDLSPFRVNPFDTTCSQGIFSYSARAFAQRGEKVFFIAYDTQQYGVGRWDASGEGKIAEADQYLTPEAAIKRFLSNDAPEEG